MHYINSRLTLTLTKLVNQPTKGNYFSNNNYTDPTPVSAEN